MSSQPIVRAEGVVKTFGDVRALDGVSLEVERGIIYGLLGPNGAGKTTLIRVLTTLLQPDSGRAEVAGIDVQGDPVGARGKLGLAGQFAAVDDYQTGRENVEMVARLYNLSASDAARRADEVLERIHLSDAADRLVRTYSGGMRRRLDLAASLVGRPDVLFLDEPTTGIDPRSRLDLWNLIQDLVEGGTTILLTSQYLDEADRLASRIGVIDQGVLVTEGTPVELKSALGGDVIEVHVNDADCSEGRRALASLSDEEPTYDEAAGMLAIPATDGAATLLRVVRALDDAGITPNDVALRKPTLDEVFMAVTGHTAESVAEPTEGSKKKRRRERSAQ
ncbi:MAG: ATP-binding cassette domain-containing protein [Acidimicrobiia bacterium]|nr:ATP-binding cassette domain-containing protein [Acidimicrobiia bacterium]